MQPTLDVTRPTPHGTLRLVKAMPAWLVKTRRAPSRLCRDARVYGHTTTAVDDMSSAHYSHVSMPGTWYSGVCRMKNQHGH